MRSTTARSANTARTLARASPAGLVSRAGPLTHLNAGIVHEGRLYAAHSNYPGVPMLSSVEIWDTRTMQHVGSHSFGRTDGSLTWIDRRGGGWIACFAHYGRKGGEPGRGPEWTRLVEFDDDWRQTGAWALPADLLAHISGNGYSCSGGAFGPGGFLYVTGHDNAELYVLDFPDAGPVLNWIAMIPVAAQGQAFCWDPVDRNVIHMLSRSSHEIISGRVTIPVGTRALTGSREASGRLFDPDSRLVEMVGAIGFEPTTSWSQTRRSTRLSYTPPIEL